MRITGGKLKFKEIISDKKGRKNDHIRPTSSKVREAVFNLIKHGKFLEKVDLIDALEESILVDKVVADLFCGTGILGFEAYSRGARKVIFVDQNDESLRTARKNADNLEITEDCNFVKANVNNLISTNQKVDLVLMDPPYNKDLITPSLRNLKNQKWLNNGAILIIEHGKTDEFKPVESFNLLDQRNYNNTNISIFQYIEG
jgi:16S rRNA (guanine966-N2)-methyltransferase